MDKKTLLAILLIFVVFYLSNKFFWKTPESEQIVPQAEIESVSKIPTKEEISQAEHTTFTNQGEEFSQADINDNIVLENDFVKMVFTNQGGNIKQIYLKKIMKSRQEQFPVHLLKTEKGLLNINLFTEAVDINFDECNFAYNHSDNEVEFYLKFDDGRIIQKTFQLQDGYNLAMNLNVEGFGAINSYDLGMDSGVYFDQNGDKRFTSYIKAISQIDNNIKKIKVKDAVEGKKLYGNIDWTAVKTKYFMLAAIPGRRVKLKEISVSTKGNVIKQIAKIEVSRLQFEHSFDFYLGPVDYENLRLYDIGLENSMNFGMKLIRPISKLILQLLMFLYKLIPNYGVAIIIMSIMIKIIFYPLTHKGTRSTHKMQEIQPLIKEVQSKYKNNPQKSQQEIMAIYKEHGVSPLGGCLPLLLQMPVFFALYPVLQTTIALRHSGFMLWIKDLSVLDPYSILPIVMGISMFIQQKLMSPKPSPNMDEKQLAQIKSQKIMMYGMPIFLVFIFRSLPAGLVLYWLSYNLLSICEQVLIRKKGRNLSTQ